MTHFNHEHYKPGNSLAKRESEDLIARRIRQGLGLNPKAFYIIARRIMDNRYEGSTDLDKAFSLLDHVLKNVVPKFGKPQAIDMKSQKELFERLNNSPTSVIFVRLNEQLTANAYFLISKATLECLEDLKPPMHILSEIENFWVISQEAEHFVKQFGPYNCIWEQFYDE